MEITSRKNPMVTHLKRLGASREYRHGCGEFLCDGDKLLQEAAAFGAALTAVLASGEPPALPEHVPVYRVPEELISFVSPLKTPQRVVFSCKMPRRAHAPPPGGRTIILEDMQDPGNVGAVIRTAAALGYGAVILTGACADLYNPKTVRATMGAVFRQLVIEADLAYIARLRDAGIKLFGAALGGDTQDIRVCDLKNAAVAVGSEGRGLSQELLGLCHERIRIPMTETSESLNAACAASIIMWEAVR